MFLHKRIEIRLTPLLALSQHLVQIADHLAHPGNILGSHILQGLLHALEKLLHHLLLQAIH